MEMSRHYVNLYGQDLHLNYEMQDLQDAYDDYINAQNRLGN